MSQSVPSIEPRLTKLEGQNRTLRKIVGVAGLLLAPLGVIGQSLPQRKIDHDFLEVKTLAVQSLVLVDGKGEFLGGLHTQNGAPVLLLSSDGSDKSQGTLLVGFENGKASVNIYGDGAQATLTPRAMILSSNGKQRITATTRGATAVFGVSDTDEVVRIMAIADDQGAQLLFADKAGKLRSIAGSKP